MLIAARLQRPMRAAQRGLSLVELMVGLAVGLLVVAGAALVSSSQLSDSRRLLVETQMQQDLRAAADIITRELRRTGSWGYSDFARDTVFSAATPSPVVNAFTSITITPLTVDSDEIAYRYYRTTGVPPTTGTFGFRLNADAIESNIDGTAYQQLTDSRVMKVTKFKVTQTDGPPVQLACSKECPGPGGGTACYPTWTVRELAIDITGVAVADASIVRSIRTMTKLRNDLLTPSAAGQVCPP